MLVQKSSYAVRPPELTRVSRGTGRLSGLTPRTIAPTTSGR